MKKTLILITFCFHVFAMAQEVNREPIKGEIIVEGNDIEGITIYNVKSNKGTVTNKDGEFTIAVTLHDTLEIRALEYQNFDVHINKTILKSKQVKIFLIEEINKLEEIVVTTKPLTGIIASDLKRIQTFTPRTDALYFGVKPNPTIGRTLNPNQVERTLKDPQVQNVVHGLNVVNIVDQLLIPLFRSEVKHTETVRVPEIPAKAIKYYLGATFLTENFNVPEHRVEDFIRYVEDETFNFNLLNYGNELELLELLNKKSSQFLNTNKTSK